MGEGNGCGADAKRDRQVVGAVKEVTQRGVRFADGKEEQFDAIIQATGYRSNVPSWLKVKTQPTSFLCPRCSAPCRHPAPLPFSCMPGPGLAGAAIAPFAAKCPSPTGSSSRPAAALAPAGPESPSPVLRTLLLLQDGGDVFTSEGMPRIPFPNGWKGKNGLYAVGFSQRGLLGASADALNIARDIHRQWTDTATRPVVLRCNSAVV